MITINKLYEHLAEMKSKGYGEFPVALSDSSSKAIRNLRSGDIGILSDKRKYLILFPAEPERIAPLNMKELQ